MKVRILCLSAVLLVGTCVSGFSRDLFVDSGQRLGTSATWQVAVGDLDRDGDLDIVTSNTEGPAEIWLNDGTGVFTDSGQRLARCVQVEVADLDGDGAADIITGMWGEPLRVWWNDGAGGYSEARTTLAGSDCLSLAVGDLDGDGDLDVYLGTSRSDRILLNQGDRTLRESTQRFGSRETGGVVIADMDGDGDNDVVAAGWNERGHVWANDGSGTFTSICEFDATRLHVHDAACGDYDGDGDIDIFFALAGGVCCANVWLNDGDGQLTRLDLDFGDVPMHDVAVGDVDGDGMPDLAFAVGGTAPRHSSVWLRDGDGFSDLGLQTGPATGGGIELADLDGDGDLDLVLGFHVYTAGSWIYGEYPNEVWMNGSSDEEEG